jgi:hypothetical protein
MSEKEKCYDELEAIQQTKEKCQAAPFTDSWVLVIAVGLDRAKVSRPVKPAGDWRQPGCL